MMRKANIIAAAALTVLTAACTPKGTPDLLPDAEISTPPADRLSAEIMREFEGHDFILGSNDRRAEVRLPNWPPGRRVTIPFWLGMNPLYPSFLRPTPGHIYVVSEAVISRRLGNDRYLIRAGSKLFKPYAVLKTFHTRYLETGRMLPMVVRFVGAEVVTIPGKSPGKGSSAQKVPLLREVSLPMRTSGRPNGYARFEVRNPA